MRSAIPSLVGERARNLSVPRTKLMPRNRWPFRRGRGPCSDPQVILDVQQFSPDEITVRTVDNHVIVEAKHEERQDEHGYVSRHFVRRYVLPPSHDLANVTSTLSSDGVLTITAPKKNVTPAGTERVVNVIRTGVPAAKLVPVETTSTTTTATAATPATTITTTTSDNIIVSE